MTKRLDGQRVAVLAADGVEQVELVEPRRAVEEAGATTELLSISAGEIQSVARDSNPAARFPVDKPVADASPDDYDALILPGGTGNPRSDPDAMRFVQAFMDSGKPIGMLCRGPLTLVGAGVARGRTLTSYPYSGRDTPDSPDLPAFCRQIVTEFARAA